MKGVYQMKEKFKNMKGQLEIMKTLGIKPNFSELERAFGIENYSSILGRTNIVI